MEDVMLRLWYDVMKHDRADIREKYAKTEK
jgi:hypothetical protein